MKSQEEIRAEFIELVKGKTIPYVTCFIKDDGSIDIHGDLNLGCTKITLLPDNLRVYGSLFLSESLVEVLPNNLSIAGSLYMPRTKIEEIPEGTKIGNSLHAFESHLKKLPNDLIIRGCANFEGCPLDQIPTGLCVHGYLDILGTRVTRLSNDLVVKQSLFLSACDIENVVFQDECGEHKRTIFAAYVNGSVNIAAGCFLGDLETFIDLVRHKYGRGEEAGKYIAQGKFCMDELYKKLEEERKKASSGLA
ncbi:hypothetical protein LPW36_02155 [Jinshanibacter sp. LJY008]|uniref:Uncharacterized protein n=1 Tax=Limnobaculum eriocheiris TaxID=2897391 RepID=A0A9X1SIW4_9GAMM|nr:hypothetical protein [Limnobaculum eriocheiris]MCD1124848.1 hypothetical protein [Limnobaculum eriocheiris]